MLLLTDFLLEEYWVLLAHSRGKLSASNILFASIYVSPSLITLEYSLDTSYYFGFFRILLSRYLCQRNDISRTLFLMMMKGKYVFNKVCCLMGRLYTLYITLLPLGLRILLRKLMKILQKKSILLSEEVICGEKTFKRIIILLNKKSHVQGCYIRNINLCSWIKIPERKYILDKMT